MCSISLFIFIPSETERRFRANDPEYNASFKYAVSIRSDFIKTFNFFSTLNNNQVLVGKRNVIVYTQAQACKTRIQTHAHAFTHTKGASVV